MITPAQYGPPRTRFFSGAYHRVLTRQIGKVSGRIFAGQYAKAEGAVRRSCKIRLRPEPRASKGMPPTATEAKLKITQVSSSRIGLGVWHGGLSSRPRFGCRIMGRPENVDAATTKIEATAFRGPWSGRTPQTPPLKPDRHRKRRHAVSHHPAKGCVSFARIVRSSAKSGAVLGQFIAFIH